MSQSSHLPTAVRGRPRTIRCDASASMARSNSRLAPCFVTVDYRSHMENRADLTLTQSLLMVVPRSSPLDDHNPAREPSIQLNKATLPAMRDKREFPFIDLCISNRIRRQWLSEHDWLREHHRTILQIQCISQSQLERLYKVCPCCPAAGQDSGAHFGGSHLMSQRHWRLTDGSSVQISI